MDRMEEINRELDYIDNRKFGIKQFYDHCCNQKAHYCELVDALKGVIARYTNDYNELKQEKKAITERKKWEGCNQLIESEANKLVSSQTPSNAANAVIEDYARPANMCVKVAKTLND